MTGVNLIAAERKRQIEIEGWTAKHDDKYKKGELANAAACYAMTPEEREYLDDWNVSRQIYLWPFNEKWWKPTPDNRINELKKAGALIAAEIDRLLRRKNNG
jgi:hypothetical protein